MGLKIHEYPNEAFQINDEDFYDVDYWNGVDYESRKISGATLKTELGLIPNVQEIISSATVTPTFENDLVKITAQSTAVTFSNPTGTAIEGKDLMIRLKDNGTAQSVSFDTKYRAIGVTLPTTTTINKTTYIGIIYNLTDDKFDVIGVTTEA